MKEKNDFIPLKPFKKWVLENFPFIEEDFDAITSYQLWCKIVEYVNKIAYNEEKLISDFTKLKDYVDNYFDNLDIQDEIDNKLDEMAESGQLAEIIAEYLNLSCVLAYDTKEDLKVSDHLIDGSIAKTIGNETYNDGLGSFYKIRQKTEEDVIDDENILALSISDTLVAEKIFSKDIIDLKEDVDNLNIEIDKRVKLYNITTANTFEEIQNMMNDNNPKVLNFKTGSYTFNDTFRVNANTTLLFNSSTITFDIPKVTEDSSKSHGFFNFKENNNFLGYGGNGNISFIGGKIYHGNISLCHARNINFINMDFEECYTQHIIELMAIDGCLIKNCIFNGTILLDPSSGINKEYINIDPCIYESFPYFDSSATTYDHTIVKNVEIVNNEFKVPSDTSVYTGGVNFIGSHTADGNNCHRNIIVKNNLFNGTRNISIQFYNVENIIIEENEFYTANNDSITNTGSHIRFRNIAREINIINNVISGNFYAIHYGSPFNTNQNWLISGNKFSNYNNTITNNDSIINVTDLTNCRIINNTFENFTQGAIRLQASDTSVTSTHYHYISNNVFKSNDVMQSNIIRAFDGVNDIINNTFNLPNYTSKIIFIREESGIPTISGNSFSSEIIKGSGEISTTGYNKSLKNIKNIGFNAYSGNSSSLSFESPLFPFDNFTNMKLILGSGSNTIIANLNGWETAPYLDERTYNIPVVTGGNVSYVTFTINSNGTFSYDSNSTGVNLRIVTLYNSLY